MYIKQRFIVIIILLTYNVYFKSYVFAHEILHTSTNLLQNAAKMMFSEKAHLYLLCITVSKGAKIRNGYNQVPHLTQDTNGK